MYGVHVHVAFLTFDQDVDRPVAGEPRHWNRGSGSREESISRPDQVIAI